MTRAIKLLLCDDHPVVRSGLRSMLESQPDLEVIGEAGNGKESHRPCAPLSTRRSAYGPEDA